MPARQIKSKWKERVGEEIDEIVEAAAVEAGNDLLDPYLARQEAVGGIDNCRGRHQEETPAKRAGAAMYQEHGDQPGRHEPERGVGVDAPARVRVRTARPAASGERVRSSAACAPGA